MALPEPGTDLTTNGRFTQMKSDNCRYQYDTEWALRSAIESSVSMPVGALTVLGGALV